MNTADSASGKWSPVALAWPVLLKQNKLLYLLHLNFIAEQIQYIFSPVLEKTTF